MFKVLVTQCSALVKSHVNMTGTAREVKALSFCYDNVATRAVVTSLSYTTEMVGQDNAHRIWKFRNNTSCRPVRTRNCVPTSGRHAQFCRDWTRWSGHLKWTN